MEKYLQEYIQEVKLFINSILKDGSFKNIVDNHKKILIYDLDDIQAFEECFNDLNQKAKQELTLKS